MQWVLLTLAGIAAGLLGGLLGVGGSTVMIPAMVWILGTQYNGQEGMHQYQAAAMVVTSFLILPSVRVHLKNRAVWFGIWRWLAPTALIGTVLGVALSYMPCLSGKQNTRHMRYLVGAFFAYVALENLRKLISGLLHREAPTSGAAKPARTFRSVVRILLVGRHHNDVDRPTAEGYPAWRKCLVGFPMGVLSGLLGIGGGALAVPAQQSVLKMPLRNSIATSAATILCIGWVGAILKNMNLGDNGRWQDSLLLAAALTPTAMIGSYFGGHMTHKLSLNWVRVAFIALMLVSAGKNFDLI
jgi:uncharacterized protein